MPPLSVAETITLLASFAASAALSGLACSWLATVLRLSPRGIWRMAGLIGGAVIGLCLSPVSFITFGWFGAAFGAYFGPNGRWVMEFSIPISVAIGSALGAGILAAIVFGAIAVFQRCPLLGRRAATS
jgi:hypothetical protein